MKFKGIVFRGKREGSKIGYPTANIKVKSPPSPGIYAGFASVDSEDKSSLGALFYISTKNDHIVECHILDFPKNDLYGKEISAETLHMIRGDQEFSNLDEARAQIKKDELEAREWFKNREV